MNEIKLNISGNDLKSLIDHLKAGGVAGSGNFKQVVENGVLTLYNNNVKIMEQAEDGTWVRTGLYTGANSIHLGGTGTTGSKSHTLTVGGQNVVFINEWSASGNDRIAFSPAWEGVSCDGETVVESSTRVYQPLSAYEPAGTPTNPNNADNIVPCQYETIATSNLVAFNMTVISKENYVGKIYATIQSNVDSSLGSELSGEYKDVALTDNGSLNFVFASPYWLNSGDKLKISLLKDDGTPLQVLKGVSGQPWRVHNVRAFEFKSLALRDELADKVDKVAGKGLSTHDLTEARKNKIDSFEANWRGSFAVEADLLSAYPTPQAGWGAWVYSTSSVWAVKNGAWDNTGGSSFGDMQISVFDPQGIAADVFDRANHTGLQHVNTIEGLENALNLLKKHRVDVSLPGYPLQGITREIEIEPGVALRGVWTASGVFDLYLRNSSPQGAKGISFVSNWTILNSDGSYSTSGAKSHSQTVQSNSNMDIELYRGFNKDEFAMVTIYLHGDNVNNEIKRVYHVRVLGTATTINIKGYYEDIV